jgi:hypothetical protein
MSRYSIITTTDGGREEIRYGSLSDDEITRRIEEHERKYGVSLTDFLKSFSCDSAHAFELFDIMDWESLIAERAERTGSRPRLGRQ